MRIETVRAWMLVGFSLLLAGLCLYALRVTGGGKFGIFVAAMGLVYLNIGLVLTFIHDRHMAKRTRAGRE
jgi:Flp pilus assembly protein protease CpaA